MGVRGDTVIPRRPGRRVSAQRCVGDQRSRAPVSRPSIFSVLSFRGWCLTVICLLVVVLAGLLAATDRIGGNDTWLALAAGRHFLTILPSATEQRTWQMVLLDSFGIHITKRDPFGTHSNLDGWIDQSWLVHVVYFLLLRRYGVESLAAAKFAQAALIAVTAFSTGRVLGAKHVASAFVVSVAMLVSRSYIDIRPNLTSVLLAASLVGVIAAWSRGRHRALLWLLPLIVLWCNTHGGFAFAILALFTTTAGCFINRILARRLGLRTTDTNRRGLLLLCAVCVMAIVIPVFCSPYGWENLMHPFLLIAGPEAKVWRSVAEWRPLWQPGFGRVVPYILFLAFAGATACARHLLSFERMPWQKQPLHPPTAASATCDSPSRASQVEARLSEQPCTDVTHVALCLLVTCMSLQSRRFVFLSAVVIAPFLAKWLCDIQMMLVRMTGAQRRAVATRHSGAHVGYGVQLAALCTTVVLLTAILTQTLITTYYNPRLKQFVFFWPMVAVGNEPVRALEAMNEMGLRGSVFNEWSQAGYVAFGQRPNPQTGVLPTRVFIDGRAQTAYSVTHFLKWETLRSRAADAAPDDYGRLLATEGIDVVLLRRNKSYTILKKLHDSGMWKRVYADRYDEILVQRKAPYVSQ